MKPNLLKTILLLLIFLPTSLSFADVPARKVLTITSNTEESLLEGLRSDNLGLKTSCAYMLGELKIKSAVIPLLRVLKEDDQEEARIAAALALYKIGTPLAIFSIKQSAKFDESKRVSNLALNFYNEYLRNKLMQNKRNGDSTYVVIK
jgi:hypothetical protein